MGSTTLNPTLPLTDLGSYGRQCGNSSSNLSPPNCIPTPSRPGLVRHVGGALSSGRRRTWKATGPAAAQSSGSAQTRSAAGLHIMLRVCRVLQQRQRAPGQQLMLPQAPRATSAWPPGRRDSGHVRDLQHNDFPTQSIAVHATGPLLVH